MGYAYSSQQCVQHIQAESRREQSPRRELTRIKTQSAEQTNKHSPESATVKSTRTGHSLQTETRQTETRLNRYERKKYFEGKIVSPDCNLTEDPVPNCTHQDRYFAARLGRARFSHRFFSYWVLAEVY